MARKFMVSIACGGILSCATAGPAMAYNISVKGRVHERMTALAEICAAHDPKPARCPLPSIVDFKRVPWKKSVYWSAVRWADDPTRQGNVTGAIKFTVNVAFGKCRDYLAFDDKFAGIVCNSHYGRLQFMHAMASDVSETPERTRGLIVAWARFAFGVAAGRIGTTDPYCRAVRAEGALIGDALAPANFPYCLKQVYPAWQVRTLFTLRCLNPVSSAVCTEPLGEQADRIARDNATGALLHLIQDSYSRSHAARGETLPEGPYRAIVDCQPARSFYLYSANKRRHGAADKLPTFSTACGPQNNILDPITASARMLQYVRAGDAKSEEAAMEMIAEQVLGAADA